MRRANPGCLKEPSAPDCGSERDGGDRIEPGLDWLTGLESHEHYARCDEQGCRPTPSVNVLVQEDLGSDRIGHEGQRCCSWSDQADVVPGQSKQQAVERYRHAAHSQKEVSIA